MADDAGELLQNHVNERVLVEWEDVDADGSVLPCALGSYALSNKQDANLTLKIGLDKDLEHTSIHFSSTILVATAKGPRKREAFLHFPIYTFQTKTHTSPFDFEILPSSDDHRVSAHSVQERTTQLIRVQFKLDGGGHVFLPKTTAKIIKPKDCTAGDLLRGLKSLSNAPQFVVYIKWSRFAQVGLEMFRDRLHHLKQYPIILRCIHSKRVAEKADWDAVELATRHAASKSKLNSKSVRNDDEDQDINPPPPYEAPQITRQQSPDPPFESPPPVGPDGVAVSPVGKWSRVKASPGSDSFVPETPIPAEKASRTHHHHHLSPPTRNHGIFSDPEFDVTDGAAEQIGAPSHPPSRGRKRRRLRSTSTSDVDPRQERHPQQCHRCCRSSARAPPQHPQPPPCQRETGYPRLLLPAAGVAPPLPLAAALPRTATNPAGDGNSSSDLLLEVVHWHMAAKRINPAVKRHARLRPHVLALGAHAREGDAARYAVERARCSALLFYDPFDEGVDEEGEAAEVERTCLVQLEDLLGWMNEVSPGGDVVFVEELLHLGRLARGAVDAAAREGGGGEEAGKAAEAFGDWLDFVEGYAVVGLGRALDAEHRCAVCWGQDAAG